MNNTILISYDLIKPGQDYTDLIDSIKQLTTLSYWHCLESVWIIKTSLSCVEVRDKLNPKIDNNDKLLVLQLSGVGAWSGFNTDCSNWLKNNL